MASSRWKRFAFFEKCSLPLPPEVVETVLGSTASADSGRRREDASTLGWVVTTASLPLHQKGVQKKADRTSSATRSLTDEDATDVMDALWSSWRACHGSHGDATTEVHEAVRSSPRDATAALGGVAATRTVEGLVLGFLSSPLTHLVHCVDLTQACYGSHESAPMIGSQKEEESEGKEETTVPLQHQPLGCWRGYFDPFAEPPPRTVGAAANKATSPLPLRRTSTNQETIVGIASCRVAAESMLGDRPVQGQSLGPLHVACITAKQLVVWQDPHCQLSCRRPLPTVPHAKEAEATRTANAQSTANALTSHCWRLLHPWGTNDGNATTVDIMPGLVAIGTDTGAVLVFHYNVTAATVPATHTVPPLRPYLRIPPPLPMQPSNAPVSNDTTSTVQVISVKLAMHEVKEPQQSTRASVYCVYRPREPVTDGSSASSQGATTHVGICCYELSLPATTQTSVTPLSAPLARHDLDGRIVASPNLVHVIAMGNAQAQDHLTCLTVARPDGIYAYSRTRRMGVAPIDGPKVAYCHISSPPPLRSDRNTHSLLSVASDSNAWNYAGYSLVASTDAKSGRDAVDIYDPTNKLVAFHLLLSPGQWALQAASVTSTKLGNPPAAARNRGVDPHEQPTGRSTAVILTSTGTVLALVEKSTREKIALLVQKHLYAAAIAVAYADPSYEPDDITALFRTFAEYLYAKGDFTGAMDQYIHTIGSLESSHVIYRFLEAPKIPLLVKYLEKFREQQLATPAHMELLRTCYLKLNDVEAAEALAMPSRIQGTRSAHSQALLSSSLLTNLSENPRDVLAAVCSLEAAQVVDVLTVHGVTLTRTLPREMAGIILALCMGTYSPKAMAEASLMDAASLTRMMEYATEDKDRVHAPYPIHLFAPAFLEHPRLLRLILSHCNRHKCYITPSLRRTLLELTLDEWNQAKRTGDTEIEKLRHQEAIAALTDSHCSDIGDYDALVLVQMAGFKDGELLLYERLQMTPMLLERYANDSSEKSRRALLALSRNDPEVLAEVLGYLVRLAGEKIQAAGKSVRSSGDQVDEGDEVEEILDDIQEALALAKSHGLLPPVRVTRILAGEGTGQFSERDHSSNTTHQRSVPLSVAIDYVGSILEESRKDIFRLTNEVEEYNRMCNSLEQEIESLERAASGLPADSEATSSRFNIDEAYNKVRAHEGDDPVEITEQQREAFWRELSQADDKFEIIARYFAKGIIQ